MNGYRVSAYRAPCGGGLNRSSRLKWKLETRTAQGPGGENRITHSTLHGGVLADGEDPQKLAILGPRRGSRGGRKALARCGPQQRGFLERSYINHLPSRSVDLLATRGRV